MDTFWGMILRKSQKRHFPKYNVFFGEKQNGCPGAMPPSECSQDVRARRPDGAFLKGKLKAGRQKAPHLGPGLEPKGGTSDIRDQNYLYAHLLKGGLYGGPHTTLFYLWEANVE